MGDEYLPGFDAYEGIENPPLTGEEQKELGMSRVSAAADPREIERIDEALLYYAKAGLAFTSDDVRAASQPITRPNLVGARFHHAARMGLIASVGTVKAKRAARHSATIHLWKGASGVNTGAEKEEAMATRERNQKLVATQKVIDTLAGFSKKERANIINFVLEEFELGVLGAQIDAAEARKAEARKASVGSGEPA